MKPVFSLFLFLGVVLASARAQTPQQLQAAFAAIRSDNVQNNCGDAVSFLYHYREKLKGDILDQLYRSDEQGKSALMYVLFNTKSFRPDQRFLNLVASTLTFRHPIRMASGYDFPEAESIKTPWAYIDAHFELFEPLLAAQVSAKNVWVSWAAAWMLKKHDVLERNVGRFTADVLANAVANMRNDSVEYNASQAVRLFLLIGDPGLPILREAVKAGDAQTKDYCRALIDALTKGKHEAFAYLNWKTELSYVLVGEEPAEPEWLQKLTETYADKEVAHYP